MSLTSSILRLMKDWFFVTAVGILSKIPKRSFILERMVIHGRTQQLLTQMNHAIVFFETDFPDKQGLFIFDNSSAHCSLPVDAKAFEMNKSDSGKQWHQQDAIISNSNPVAEHHDKTQNMTLPDGNPQGMQHVLQE